MSDPIITNTRGKIACIVPTDANEIQLYAVPSATEIEAVLRVCNTSDSAASYRVAHCSAGHGDTAANLADHIFYDYPLEAKDTDEIPIFAKATETIRVKASVGNVISFHLSGNKKVIS